MGLIERLFFLVPAVLVAITFHEFAHGYVAYRLGDPTPKYTGRLTLNPLAHLDPVGALMLILFHFGWAKPVLINPSYFKDQRRGMLMVGIAGPLANVLFAWCLVLILKLLSAGFNQWAHIPVSYYWLSNFFQFIQVTISINLWLAAFNLIPIPPLDGSKVLMGILPGRYTYAFARLEQYGWIILILLVVSGMVGPLLQPIYRALYGLITLI